MIEANLSQNKLVIPRWRHWRTDLAGDIAKAPSVSRVAVERPRVAELRELLRDEVKGPFGSVRQASRIVSEAVLLGEYDLAQEVAKYVQGCSGVLGANAEFVESVVSGKEQVNGALVESEFRLEITRIKRRLFIEPKNAILWIEKSRLHTILGQKEKAIESAVVALNLAPLNRYVVRSAGRLFMHYDEWDMAWYFVLKAFKGNPDPWLKSLAVSIGTRAEVGKMIPNFRPKIFEAHDEQELFTFSELNAATAMLELSGGNDLKAKKIFKYAWKNPASTVISHAMWIINNKIPGLSLSANIDFAKNIQAASYDLLNRRKYKDSLPTLNGWLMEEPFSSEPHDHLYTAYMELRRFDDAIFIANKAKQSNSSDISLLNQIAYAYLRKDDSREWEKAGAVIKEMDMDVEYRNQPVPRATKGMYLMLTGRMEEGVDLYYQSMREFKKKKMVESNLVCVSNFLMNYIRVSKGIPVKLYSQVVDRLGRHKSNYVRNALFALKETASLYEEVALPEKHDEKTLDTSQSELL